ncbi:hypothetical protein HELRODRAFT_188494 [Helobdella robusta]|uniref:Alpha/beta hydrolase fold-3 domain-containing protein n=1 Tax=Helobdella robusta TaxID=6412 RepID=T1FQ20_HELRO|nr:hypothetical protein HELRODRAFT_188494 [Helobdella robusta]ESO01833.1 hypothetical protein HELRODRAFT_188494 [Helobdella robusta]
MAVLAMENGMKMATASLSLLRVTADEDKQRTVNIASNMDDNKQFTQFSLDYQEEGDAVDNVSTSNSDSHEKFNDRAKVSSGKKSLHDNIKNNGTKSADSSPDSFSLAEDHKNPNISKNDQTFENKKNSMVYKRKKSSKSLSSTPTTPLKQKSTADFKLYKSLSLYSDVDALYCENIFKQNNVVQVQDYALYRNFTTDYFTELRQKTETNRDPFLSPVFASDELLRGLCPVHFIACKYDPLLDDTIHFARKVKEAGGQVDLHLVDDLPHGFLNFKQFTKESSAASDVCVQSLKCLLNVDECALHVNSISCQDTTIFNVSTNATVSNAGNDVSNVGNDVSDVCDVVASQQASDVCLGTSACDDSVVL